MIKDDIRLFAYLKFYRNVYSIEEEEIEITDIKDLQLPFNFPFILAYFYRKCNKKYYSKHPLRNYPESWFTQLYYFNFTVVTTAKLREMMRKDASIVLFTQGLINDPLSCFEDHESFLFLKKQPLSLQIEIRPCMHLIYDNSIPQPPLPPAPDDWHNWTR